MEIKSKREELVFQKNDFEKYCDLLESWSHDT